MPNKVSGYWWDKDNRYGQMEINGVGFGLHRPEIGWDDENFRPKLGYGVVVANDFNMSAKFVIVARTLKQLAAKVARHQYKLVKGG